MSEENFDEEKLTKEKEPREDFNGIFNKIKNHLLEYYLPVHDPREAEFHYTTSEIHMQLLKLFPSDYLTADVVANWLHLGGFEFYDFGEMKFEWLMKKA